MNYKIAPLLLLCIFSIHTNAQKKASFNTGVELDVLPYATGGWFTALWAGKEHWRLRVLTAVVNKPDFTTKKDFTNHHINAYALVVDRFLNKDWKGWWMGGGIVVWNSSIQSNAKQQTAKFSNYLINGSSGYNIKLHKNIYIAPWAGISVRVGGNTNVPVDNKLYTLPFFNPEASIKIGIWF